MKPGKIVILIGLILVPLTDLSAQENCGRKLLVSSYDTNDVKVFDACTGDYLRSMSGGGLSGAQAIRRGPDGYLYVVSEESNRIVRFDAETLDFVDVFASDDTGLLEGPTGLDFGPGGDLYVGGFGSNNVVRFDGSSGQLQGEAIGAGAGLLGVDAGLGFGPDGALYVPGYTSNNVLRFTAEGQQLDPLATGITQPRMILFDEGRDRILVSAWGEGKVRRFRLSDGVARGSLVPDYGRPTGMAFDVDGTLLLTSDVGDAVVRVDPVSGDLMGALVSPGAGGLSGATFLYVLVEQGDGPAPAPEETDDLYWLSGLGNVEGNRIVVEEVSETSGAAFGQAFDPADVTYRRWGSIEIEFTGCTRAQFAWTSDGPDSLGFGSGSYAIQPVAEGLNIQRCLGPGFDEAVAADLSWASGGWFGGSARSGEGLMLDVIDDRAFVTWFTYRPPPSGQ